MLRSIDKILNGRDYLAKKRQEVMPNVRRSQKSLVVGTRLRNKQLELADFAGISEVQQAYTLSHAETEGQLASLHGIKGDAARVMN